MLSCPFILVFFILKLDSCAEYKQYIVPIKRKLRLKSKQQIGFPFLYTCKHLQCITFFHVEKNIDIISTEKEFSRAYVLAKQNKNQFLEYSL